MKEMTYKVVVNERGTTSWYHNNKLHNETGPAIVYADGSKEWYINGKQLTEQEFNARNNKCNHDGDVVTINGIEYKLNRIG